MERDGWEEWDYADFSLPEDTGITALIGSHVTEHYDSGETIIEIGTPADAVYVVLSGDVEVLQPADATMKLTRTLGAGQPFGEIGVLTNAPRSATVKAGAAGARVGKLPAKNLLEAIATADLVASELLRIVQRRQLSDRLRTVLPKADAAALGRALGPVRVESVPADTIVIAQGAPSDHFYLVQEGNLDVRQTTNGADRSLKTLDAGDFFGELGLLTGRVRSASVVTNTPSRLVSMDQQAFRHLLSKGGPGRFDLLKALNESFKAAGLLNEPLVHGLPTGE